MTSQDTEQKDIIKFQKGNIYNVLIYQFTWRQNISNVF
jgi:hypothetical protein